MLELCELDSPKFDALQRIITILESCEFILIRQGKIHHSINTNIISADLSNMLGTDFNLDIINPRKYLKLFKTMVRKNIKLYDDSEMSRYIISNNEIKLFLPKKAGNINPPKLQEMKPVGVAINIKDNKKTIKNLIGTSETKLLIHENQLKGLLVEGTGIYQFPEFADDDIDESNCEMLLSYGFLSIDSDEYFIHLGKDNSNNYWIYTLINIDANNQITMLENVTKKNLDNLLI